MSHAKNYFAESIRILEQLDPERVERMVEKVAEVRERGGRLFFLGVGGGAAHASHAVNDFRKLCCMECYTPSDNAAELTARINDEGWDSCYAAWLQGSRLKAADGVFVFSVGGGSRERNISKNLVEALVLARQVGAAIVGVVGRDGGYTAEVADACVVVPTVNEAHVTPHTEAFQAVIWHLMVSHPKLQARATKWEGTVSATGA